MMRASVIFSGTVLVKSPTLFISAGEASGEHYGTLLIDALKRRLNGHGLEARFVGMGGERMAVAGLARIVRAEDVSVMGLTEVVRHLPHIWREFQRLKAAIRSEQPAVAVLIDFPEIHLRLARLFHQLGIPVVYFVSPQIWAWKQHRIHQIQAHVRRMAVIFPFEAEFYRRHGVKAEFVGHPLAELALPSVSREEFAQANGLDPQRPWVALLPGSRPHEIRDHLPELLATARLLTGYQFLVPLAPTLNAAQRDAVRAVVEVQGAGLPVHLVEDARAALHHARASVVASGTATVEAALIGNPFVVIYRVSRLTYAIARRMVKVPHVAMANLIAGRRMVPELLQNEFRAANIASHLRPLLADGPARASMMQELAAMGNSLRPAHGGGPQAANQTGNLSIERVAAMVIEELGLEAAGSNGQRG